MLARPSVCRNVPDHRKKVMSENPYDSSYSSPPATLHSGLGIASFVTSLLGGLAGFAVIVGSVVVMSENVDALAEDDPGLILLGLGAIGCGGLILVSIVLGFAALFQADRKKLFAVLGLVFSGLACLAFVGMLILGSMA